MLLYNTTFAVDRSLEKEFLEWLEKEFIPTTIDRDEYFESVGLYAVESCYMEDTSSYALHLIASNRENVDLWYEDHGSRLFAQILERWQGGVTFFSTFLSSVLCVK